MAALGRNDYLWRGKSCKPGRSWIAACILLNLAIIKEVAAALPLHLRHSLSLPPPAPAAGSIEELDREIQNYAFQSFNHSKTGSIYNVTLPSTLTGLRVQAVRLRSGSLRRHGLIFNEFSIPPGTYLDDPTQTRVLLIYREFTGLNVYSPERYTLVSPVIGMKVYSTSNLSTPTSVPELHLTAFGALVTVRIPFVGIDSRNTALCASLSNSGSVSISNLTSPPNVCSSSNLGDFSLVIPLGLPPSFAPATSESPSPQSDSAHVSSTGGKRRKNAWKIAVGSALVGFTLLVLMTVLALMVARSIDKTRIAKMEFESERGETLHTALIGNSRAPTAGSARTRPSLENDYSP